MQLKANPLGGAGTGAPMLVTLNAATPPETNSVPDLLLRVLSLRYSSWSIRPWLALTEAGAPFSVETIEIEDLAAQGVDTSPALTSISKAQLARRRAQGSITGLFPVLYVDGNPIHESLAICEWVAEAFPEAALWPDDSLERARARAVSCEMGRRVSTASNTHELQRLRARAEASPQRGP